ncbi:MAG: hypothetical protein KC478_06510 [Bacteriovoracaceae bacterium]|nr:hypothetical protein [Bacteriovoracaceae bacterium]
MYTILIALTLCLPGNELSAKNIKPIKARAQSNLKKLIKNKIPLAKPTSKAKITTKDVNIPDKDLKTHSKIVKILNKKKIEHMNELEKLIAAKMNTKKFQKISTIDQKDLKKHFSKKDISIYNSLKELLKTKQISFNQETSKYLYREAPLSLIRYRQISRVLQINPKLKKRYDKLIK